MVKGISRQVIVIHSPDPKLFEQAIFILKDEVVGKTGITEADILKEANRIINRPSVKRKYTGLYTGPAWAVGGAVLTALAWLISLL